METHSPPASTVRYFIITLAALGVALIILDLWSTRRIDLTVAIATTPFETVDATGITLALEDIQIGIDGSAARLPSARLTAPAEGGALRLGTVDIPRSAATRITFTFSETSLIENGVANMVMPSREVTLPIAEIPARVKDPVLLITILSDASLRRTDLFTPVWLPVVAVEVRERAEIVSDDSRIQINGGTIISRTEWGMTEEGVMQSGYSTAYGATYRIINGMLVEADEVPPVPEISAGTAESSTSAGSVELWFE